MLVELSKHINRRSNHNVTAFSNIIRKKVLREELFNYCLEYVTQNLLGRSWNIYNVEVSHKSGCQGCSASSRWSSGTDQLITLNLLLVILRLVIDNVCINEKSEEFNRRLGSILLNKRHVNVVNENQTLLAAIGPDHFLASLFHKFRLNTSLNTGRTCLS